MSRRIGCVGGKKKDNDRYDWIGACQGGPGVRGPGRGEGKGEGDDVEGRELGDGLCSGCGNECDGDGVNIGETGNGEVLGRVGVGDGLGLGKRTG